MAVTYNKAVRADDTTFRVSWSSDEATPVPFRVYREGRLVSTFDSTDGNGEILLAIAPGESPFLEVLDRACQVPSLAFPGGVTLSWAATGNASYRIEELVSAVWTARQTIRDDGSGVYRWRTRWLEDDTSHQFRVYPVSAAGNDGTAITFTFLMVRHPDAPSVGYTYNGSATPTVTIAAS